MAGERHGLSVRTATVLTVGNDECRLVLRSEDKLCFHFEQL